MNTEMDPYWNAFNISDYETYRTKFLRQIYLKPEVHENVRESFRVIERLLEFGFCEHRFFDVAYSKATLTLEMAFKQRYIEIHGKAWEGDFGPLMDWLKSQNYFDVYNKHFIGGLRDIRNHFAHPSTEGFVGPGQTHLVLYPMDLINSTYEDNNLTQKRFKTSKQFYKKTESMGPGLRITVDGESHIAFNIWLSFYDNKSIPAKAHIYAQPVYEIPNPYFTDGKFQFSPYYYWQAAQVIIDEDVISLPSKDGRTFEVRPITCEVERQIFLQWRKKYHDFDMQTGDRISRTSFATDTFLQHLREFHKS